MIKRLQIFRTDCTDPHRNLAVEQALLEAVGEVFCSSVRQAYSSPSSCQAA